MFFGLKLLCLLLQLVITGMVAHQLWHPYRSWRWNRAWKAFLLASVFLVGRRVYDLWFAVSLFDIFAAIGVSTCLLFGLWSFVRLYETELQFPPVPPESQGETESSP